MINRNLSAWSTALGALPRIAGYQRILGSVEIYFDRLRIVNDALGPHWIFRLVDVVGKDVIKANRPSWFDFYINDTDRLHCPLDPGAPETDTYLGRKYSDMDLALYAGMGFDGYRLVLETSRLVDRDKKQIIFDGRYTLTLPDNIRAELEAFEKNRFVPKEDYYAAYAGALTVLFDGIHAVDDHSEEHFERLAAGCLILMCGGHQGCTKHPSPEDAFKAQMDSLIIFNIARHVMLGMIPLSEQERAPRLHAVGSAD